MRSQGLYPGLHPGQAKKRDGRSRRPEPPKRIGNTGSHQIFQPAEKIEVFCFSPVKPQLVFYGKPYADAISSNTPVNPKPGCC